MFVGYTFFSLHTLPGLMHTYWLNIYWNDLNLEVSGYGGKWLSTATINENLFSAFMELI